MLINLYLDELNFESIDTILLISPTVILRFETIFRRTFLYCNISDTTFDRSGTHHGLNINEMAGEVRASNISATSNAKTGLRIYDGMGSILFQRSSFTSNGEDGCYITNQGKPPEIICGVERV